MASVIRIPANIYERLENLAQGFDTPANVIEKLLNHYEKCDQSISEPPQHPVARSRRDTTKYLFNSQTYGKGRLVLAVVKDYVARNPQISFDELLEQFSKGIQGSSGVFNHQQIADEIYKRTGHKRHFVKSSELVQLSDSIVAVSKEWGADNIDEFVRHAESLGLTISRTTG